METLLEKKRNLDIMVNIMSDFKNDSSEKGKEIYIKYREECFKLIEKLRLEGVNVEENPIFENVISSFNYWK